MLPVPFSFSGRLARWPYFKWCAGLVAACFIPAVLAFSMYPQLRAGDSVAIVGLCVMLGLMAVIMIWISLALQVRRCRDIGWEPLYVIPAWFALQFADPFLAELIPALAVGRHHNQTLICGLVNLFMVAALIFWPSGDEEARPTAPASRDVPSGCVTFAGPKAVGGAARTSFGRR